MLLFLLGLLCVGAKAGDFTNGVKGTPLLEKCTLDTIIVQFNFKEEFNGVLFTLDKDPTTGEKTCVKRLNDGYELVPLAERHHNEIEATFQRDTCTIKKDHVTVPGCNPSDFPADAVKPCEQTAYTITVYLQFWAPHQHPEGDQPNVHTKIDKAYTFACIPNDESAYENTFLEVIDVTPETVTRNFTVNPVCEYCISDISPVGTPDASPNTCVVKDAPVSFHQKIFHEVHCQHNIHWKGAYCLEVEKCLASFKHTTDITELDKTNSITIIENDCTQDAKLISSFAYSGNTWAYAESHPFHVGHPDDTSDNVDVYFYCQIRYFPSDKTDACPNQGCTSGDARRKREVEPFNLNHDADTMIVTTSHRFKRNTLSRMVTL